MSDQPYVAQLFGETDDHWLFKVGKREDSEFELDESQKAKNRFFIIYFREEPPT